jgi:hypothetical protein
MKDEFIFHLSFHIFHWLIGLARAGKQALRQRMANEKYEMTNGK